MSDVRDLLTRALSLEATAPSEAIALYARALERDVANLTAHNALERLRAPQAYGHWMNVDCTIDPRDDIFSFFANHHTARNPIREYLADGWRTLAELMVLLERQDRPLVRMGSVLEFASGFGRFTRHLTTVVPNRLSCADVLPGSAEFARAHFGVEAFGSASDPDAIEWPRRYELVFVLSLFTHLPLTAWPRWIARLAQAVEPGGLLVFTIHNPDHARDEGVVFDAEGGLFIPSSESRSLEAAQYGTTFTTSDRARREVARIVPEAKVQIHERAFWHGQDAVVVPL